MTIVLNVLIGIIGGGLLAWLTNWITKTPTKFRKINTYIVGIALGALGAQSADQLLNYGPTLLGSSFVPSIVGGIVLAFVGLYAGKKWAHL